MAGMLFDGKNEAAMSQATTIEGGKQSCEVVDVSDLVFKPDCFCLNQSSDEPFENVLKPDASLLKSDADEQLLMHFAFKEPVRLNGLEITAPASDEAPKTLKLYCNRLNMGFDDCDGGVPTTAEIELTAASVMPGVRIPLALVKWQRVDSVTIFVEDNQGGADETAISQVRFFGNTTAGTKSLGYALQPGSGARLDDLGPPLG